MPETIQNKSIPAFSGPGDWINDHLFPSRLYIAYLAYKNLHRGTPELAYARDHLTDPDKNFIDVGANKGWWSYVLSAKFREVYAFEPNPQAYRFLSRWRRGNVSTYPVALSDYDGRSRLRIPRKGHGFSRQSAFLSHSRSSLEELEGIEVDIDCRRLDSYGFSTIGLIKIDVEGHEAAVLAGAQEILARDQPILIIEISRTHTKQPIRKTIEPLLDWGYISHMLRDNHLMDLNITDMDQSIDGGDFIFIPEKLKNISRSIGLKASLPK